MIIEMKNIRKEFDGLEVLKDISFGVDNGEVVSIIGPSGSGKSTLLRCATFLETIDGGEIVYMGEKAAHTDESGRAVYVIHGMYDVPVKTTDHQSAWESEEVYSYLIVSICPLRGEYDPEKPVCGLLYPAFTNRSSDPAHVNIYAGSNSFFRTFLKL